ncbi:MAG: hypothetical protein OEV40_18755 [Acidimicrobiia bacterium]|nr:hypothetical protein [Acidimicrobiia bacterium]
MTTTVVRYKVSEGRGDENQALVEAVFEELARTQPGGLRYATVRLDDGVTFVHIAQTDDANPLGENEAFGRFTADIAARCDEPPAPMTGTVIGNYRLYQE